MDPRRLQRIADDIHAVCAGFDPKMKFEVVDPLDAENVVRIVPWRKANPGQVYVFISATKALGDRLLELCEQLEKFDFVAAVFASFGKTGETDVDTDTGTALSE